MNKIITVVFITSAGWFSRVLRGNDELNSSESLCYRSDRAGQFLLKDKYWFCSWDYLTELFIVLSDAGLVSLHTCEHWRCIKGELHQSGFTLNLDEISHFPPRNMNYNAAELQLQFHLQNISVTTFSLCELWVTLRGSRITLHFGKTFKRKFHVVIWVWRFKVQFHCHNETINSTINTPNIPNKYTHIKLE